MTIPIPKNGRSRRKQQHDTTTSVAAGKNSGLGTVTRTSNHGSIDTVDHHSSTNDASSNCSWVELDFDIDQQQGVTTGKPVSHVNLVDDVESSSEANNKNDDDDSSTTSNLSEDYSVEVKGAKGERDDDDDDISVNSFGSASVTVEDGVTFNDLLTESLLPSNHNSLASMGNILTDSLVPMDEIIELRNGSSSSGNDDDLDDNGNGNATIIKPSSERSKGAIKPSSERSRGAIKPSSERSRGATKKQPKKTTLSPKPKPSKKKLALKSSKRIHGDGTVDESGSKKKLSPKPMPPSPKSKLDPSRRRRLRSSDGTETSNHGSTGAAVENEDSKDLLKEGGSRHEKRPEPHRTKSNSKSKEHRRKSPSRHSSGRNEELGRNSKGGGDPSQRRARELRKRYKKKSSSSGENDSEEDTESHNNNGTPTKSRSIQKEANKKTRSKSNDPKARVSKTDHHPEGKKRRKKKPPASKAATTTATATTTEENKSPKQQNRDVARAAAAAATEKMTYSFNMNSESDDNRNNWLNSNNSSSSSLSYNSFAQFSLDVGEMNMSVLGGSCAFVPDLDASQQSFNSNHSMSLDSAVVFMAAKSSRTSLLTAHSLDENDDQVRYDMEGLNSRSSTSMPMASTENSICTGPNTSTSYPKPEKQLRRRLKKKEQPTAPDEKDNNNDGNNNNNTDGNYRNRNDSNSEAKRKVRRTKSGDVERTKTLLSHNKKESKQRSLERTKSLNATESPVMPGETKLVPSAAKRQQRQEKSHRRKKEKRPESAKNMTKSRPAGKAKSGHMRPVSISPKNPNQKGKIVMKDEHINFNITNTMNNNNNNNNNKAVFVSSDVEDKASPETSAPTRSPKGRQQVPRTSFSTHCPSPSTHFTDIPPTPTTGAKNAIDIDCSPMSYGSHSPFGVSKKVRRRPSISRQALLSTDSDFDDDDLSDTGYSAASPNSPLGRSRGLNRTPSTLLAAAGNKMLSRVKRTFSVSGRGGNTFTSTANDVDIGMTTIKGYVGRKERQRKINESENRRGLVKNSLYACMDDDDDSVEISSEIFEDITDDSSHEPTNYAYGSAAKSPKRINSLVQERNKPNKGSVVNSERKEHPRRTYSLPLGIRRLPPA